MMHTRFRDRSIEQLVALYADIGIAQYEADLYEDVSTFNELYSQKVAVTEELKSRFGDQRRALMQLYSHPNIQVRLNAASATLAVAPNEARKVLEEIRQSGWQPQALDAGMLLWNLDRGVFKPI